MGFLFGLFRFLTWGNIVVLAIFVLSACISLIVGPSALQVFIILVVFALVLHQNLLSTKLQNAIMDPEVQLSRAFPPIYIVICIFVLVYSFLGGISIAAALSLPSSEFLKGMKEGPAGNLSKEEQAQVMTIIRPLLVLISIHFCAVFANGVLAFLFFNRWKKDLATRANNDSIIDINP